MNNKIIVGIVAVALIGGVAAYFVTKKTPAPAVQGEKTETAAAEEPAAQSLQDLLASGQAKNCQFTDIQENGKTEGEAFIGSGKVRVNFTATQNGEATTGHVIVDGQTSYIWTEGMSTGFKIAQGAQSSPATGSNPAGDLVDQNKKLDYNCSDWSVDASKFELPQGVTFNDLGAVMQ